MRSKRNRILGWAINLAGILAFGLVLYLGGVEAWEQILRGDWRFMLAALGVTLLWNLVAAYRWELIAERVAGGATPCPFRYYFTYHMIGMLVAQVVPITVGMLGGRPVALTLSRDVPLRRAALSVFIDKFFDLILALLLVLPVAVFLVDWVSLPLSLGLMAGAVLGGALLVAWRYEWSIQLLARYGSRLARPLTRVPFVGQRLVRRLPQQLERLAEVSLLPNALALRAFLLTLVMYVLLSARLVFIAEALRLEIPWYLLAMGVCVTQLALIFSVTPGSLGFLEGGWAAVLSLGGVTMAQFTTFVIGRRAYFVLFTSLITLLAFGWIRESPAHLFRAVMAASRQPAAAEGGAPAAAEPEGGQQPSL